jgi:hypothetical protein
MKQRYKKQSVEESQVSEKHSEFKFKPKKLKKPKAVVVYLCCADEKEARDLEISVELWTKHAHAYFPYYPVLVVHDFLSKEMEEKVSSTSLVAYSQPPLDLKFAWLEPEDWHGAIPDGFDPSSMPVYRYGMGYRHMCRFFTGSLVDKVWQHMPDAEWVLRIDTDSFILTPLLVDPFQHMEDGKVS